MLTINGVSPTQILYNGTDLTAVYARQTASDTPVLVWSKSLKVTLGGDTDSQLSIYEGYGIHIQDSADFSLTLSNSYPYPITFGCQLRIHKDDDAVTEFLKSYPISLKRGNSVVTTIPIRDIDPKACTWPDGVNDGDVTELQRIYNVPQVLPTMNANQTLYGENLSDGNVLESRFFLLGEVYCSEFTCPKDAILAAINGDDYTLSNWQSGSYFDDDDDEIHWAAAEITFTDYPNIRGFYRQVTSVNDIPEDDMDYLRSHGKTYYGFGESVILASAIDSVDATFIDNTSGSGIFRPTTIIDITGYDAFRYTATMNGVTYYGPWTTKYGFTEFEMKP